MLTRDLFAVANLAGHRRHVTQLELETSTLQFRFLRISVSCATADDMRPQEAMILPLCVCLLLAG